MRVKNIPVDDIEIGKHHRKDIGDLTELASSIEAEGLLQPIGVDRDNVLVFVERRLRAIADVQEREKIPAAIIDVTSIVAGE